LKILERNRTDLFIWLGYLGKANSRTHQRESLRQLAINLKSTLEQIPNLPDCPRITVILAVNQRLSPFFIYHCIRHYATK